MGQSPHGITEDHDFPVLVVRADEQSWATCRCFSGGQASARSQPLTFPFPAMSKRMCRSIRLEKKVPEVNSGKLSRTGIAKERAIAEGTPSGTARDGARMLERFHDGDFGPERKRMRRAAQEDLEDFHLSTDLRSRPRKWPRV